MMEKQALSVPGVLRVHGLRAEYVGPEIVHAGMRIEVASGTPIEEADRIAHEVEAKIHAGKSPGYCFIHVDPEKGSVNQFPGSETLGAVE
jgi:divalent metal cation (Fe/Co/Zn/Cd) transporter